ncbi:MAG: hypothetical protein U5K74_08275 [Gemmatimonadaceae bacterium]|nr:hypothetical protein [Gemmatimonadaceae bacterium]
MPVETSELKKLHFDALVARADALGVPNEPGLRVPDLIHRIELAMLRQRDQLVAEGVLDLEKGGHGFIRYQDWNFAPSPDDVYVSSAQVRRFNLRAGDWLRGTIRPPRQWEKFLALLRLEFINGAEPEIGPTRAEFDALPVKYPDERLRLEYPDCPLSLRVVDLVSPIGKGQRGLIVAPPRTGKTIMLHQIATAIRRRHHPDIHAHRAADRRATRGGHRLRRAHVPGAQVISSTFDDPPTRHVHVGDLAIERGQAAGGARARTSCMLLDFITRLGRAYNNVLPHQRPDPVRRRRFPRPPEAEEVLRRRPQHRGGG